MLGAGARGLTMLDWAAPLSTETGALGRLGRARRCSCCGRCGGAMWPWSWRCSCCGRCGSTSWPWTWRWCAPQWTAYDAVMVGLQYNPCVVTCIFDELLCVWDLG